MSVSGSANTLLARTSATWSATGSSDRKRVCSTEPSAQEIPIVMSHPAQPMRYSQVDSQVAFIQNRATEGGNLFKLCSGPLHIGISTGGSIARRSTDTIPPPAQERLRGSKQQTWRMQTVRRDLTGRVICAAVGCEEKFSRRVQYRKHDAASGASCLAISHRFREIGAP